MKRFAGLLLALGLAPQLSAQIFGPGVIHTGQGAPIKIIAPSTPQGTPATTVIINPPAPQVAVMQPQYGGYHYPYQPFHTHTQRGLPMHSMSMTPGFMYARPMYVRPTLGSMIIITPPMVDSIMPARTVFGR
ncbi:MAG: hypothetical protein EVA73_03720 [Limisphaerales bacterium]|nr:MAG: hypothetical protein EVA73_03720 [Limisphaerales bacterium]